MPGIKGHQRALDPATLPEGRAKWALFARIHDRMVGAGYRPIGMDHFALPGDELARAQRDGRLHRNFQGYTVLATSDVVGLGISAIGDVDGCYAQNAKSFRAYCEALEAGRLATERGLRRSLDDDVRRAAIESLMCNLRIDWGQLSARFGVDVRGRLAAAVEALKGGPEAEFIDEDGARLALTERGRPFVRNVALGFDAYRGERQVGSRSI
jgi:oxygen-independent coproporphyrinogen-3 oxidase